MLEPILVGAVLGGLFAGVARRLGAGGELRVLATGLVVAALIYAGLALPVAGWLAMEAGGVAVFGAIAWPGRRSPMWLAVGWTAHVAWDVGLHLDRAQPVVGSWYPLACVGFDLVVAGFLLSLALSPARAHDGVATTGEGPGPAP